MDTVSVTMEMYSQVQWIFHERTSFIVSLALKSDTVFVFTITMLKGVQIREKMVRSQTGTKYR